MKLDWETPSADLAFTAATPGSLASQARNTAAGDAWTGDMEHTGLQAAGAGSGGGHADPASSGAHSRPRAAAGAGAGADGHGLRRQGMTAL